MHMPLPVPNGSGAVAGTVNCDAGGACRVRVTNAPHRQSRLTRPLQALCEHHRSHTYAWPGAGERSPMPSKPDEMWKFGSECLLRRIQRFYYRCRRRPRRPRSDGHASIDGQCHTADCPACRSLDSVTTTASRNKINIRLFILCTIQPSLSFNTPSPRCTRKPCTQHTMPMPSARRRSRQF